MIRYGIQSPPKETIYLRQSQVLKIQGARGKVGAAPHPPMSWCTPYFSSGLLSFEYLARQKCILSFQLYTLPQKKRNFNFQIFYGAPEPGSVTPGVICTKDHVCRTGFRQKVFVHTKVCKSLHKVCVDKCITKPDGFFSVYNSWTY